MKWAYGVMTVPERFGELFPRTVRSLAAAGFESPYLFVDGTSNAAPWLDRYSLPVTCRLRVKVVGAWILSMWELYLREPNADRFALFQDDFVTYKNLRQYLSKVPYPEKGYLNLYTFPSNHPRPDNKVKDTPGFYEASLCNPDTDQIWQTGRGAIALVFSNEALVTLLSSHSLVLKPKHAAKPDTSIDGAIVNAMNVAGWREYVHYPSLTQHTGVKSTVDPRHDNQLTAPSFIGEEFDALDFLGGEYEKQRIERIQRQQRTRGSDT